MTGMLIVVDYDPDWPRLFDQLVDELRPLLADVEVRSFEHVGSTSVPGLAAKPIIDLDIVVPGDQVTAAIGALEAGGYEYLGEMGVPQRHAFRRPTPPKVNTYVVVEGSLSLRNHLALRDVLRRDDALRDRYSAVKKALADETDDIDAYVDGKTDMVLEILAAADFAADELAEFERINRS